MEHSLFPLPQIQEFLKGNLDMTNITIEDLKSPSSGTVQTVYARMLTEFGFNTESILVPSLELTSSLEHPEVYKDMLPTLTLQAAVSSLVHRLVGDSTFSIMDLLRPTKSRTQMFVSVLQNFWLFCNQRMAETDRVTAEVEAMVKNKALLEAKVENLKTKINNTKCRAVEEQEVEAALVQETEELARRLEALTPALEDLDREKMALDQELARLAEDRMEVEARKAGLQAELAALHGVFEDSATMEKLDREIEELQEDLEAKLRRKLEFRNNQEALERGREEYAAALELVKQIAEEAQKTREVVGSIREQHGHLERVQMEMDEVESHLREVVQQVADRKGEMAKARLQGERRKKGKEEELEAERVAVEAARQDVGEEQLAVVEAIDRIRDMELQEQEERDAMELEAQQVRQHYSAILETIELFNTKLARDFQRLEEAQDRMAKS